MGSGNKDKNVPKVAYAFMRFFLKLRRNSRKTMELLELAGIRKNMKILDYGCGIGNHMIEAAKLTGEKGSVLSVDINDGMILAVKKEIKRNGFAHVKTQLIDSMEDVNENNFDFILLMDVIHMVGDKTKMIAFLLSKLAPDGRLLITFEHMGESKIDAVLKGTACSDRALLIPKKKFWLLSG